MQEIGLLLLSGIGGVMLAVIGFFLRQTMQELKEVKKVTYDNKTKLEVLENDYINKIDSLNNRIDSLYNAIEKLTDKIHELSQKIK